MIDTCCVNLFFFLFLKREPPDLETITMVFSKKNQKKKTKTKSFLKVRQVKDRRKNRVRQKCAKEKEKKKFGK